jgi:hypothetical protein
MNPVVTLKTSAFRQKIEDFENYSDAPMFLSETQRLSVQQVVKHVSS